MTVICIETSTSVCSAAICKDGQPLKQCICLEGSNHARLLPLYIEELLRYANQQHLSIDAVALSEGPGSYTGLRIGTSTAKGLCYGLNVPLIPVPTLQVLSAAAKASITNDQSPITNHQSPITNCIFLPLLDARRMEVYTALYDSDLQPLSDVKAVVVENEESLTNDQSPMTNIQSVYYFGDGAAKCAAVFTKPNWHYLPDIVPEAQYLGRLITNLQSPETTLIAPLWQRITNRQLAYYEPFYLKEFIAAQSHVKGLK